MSIAQSHIWGASETVKAAVCPQQPRMHILRMTAQTMASFHFSEHSCMALRMLYSNADQYTQDGKPVSAFQRHLLSYVQVQDS